MNDVEPSGVRWKRRSRTIPLMLVTTAALLITSPVILSVAVIVDLAHLRRRCPTVRLSLFAMQYACNDSAEILLAPLLWLAAGFGTRLDGRASIRRHQRLQEWSLAATARRAGRPPGVPLNPDSGTPAPLSPGPRVGISPPLPLMDAPRPRLLS